MSAAFPHQVLAKVYSVLNDKEQRAVYDEQGVVDEESDLLSQDRCWEDHWRLFFPKVLEQGSSILPHHKTIHLNSDQ